MNTCAFCEYFDGGGAAKVKRSRGGDLLHGDCLNNRSPRFETTSNDTCSHFYKDTTIDRDTLEDTP